MFLGTTMSPTDRRSKEVMSMFAPFALSFAVLLATLIRATLPAWGRSNRSPRRVDANLSHASLCLTATSAKNATKSLKAPPEAALQMLQLRKKTGINCNNCNKLFAWLSTLAPVANCRKARAAKEREGGTAERAQQYHPLFPLNTTLAWASFTYFLGRKRELREVLLE